MRYEKHISWESLNTEDGVDTFTTDVEQLYRAVGHRHILPFTGAAFDRPRPDSFRIAVIGFNSYISPGDWPEPEHRIHSWFRDWWRNAGRGKGSHRYYDNAFREAVALTQAVTAGPRWRDLAYDLTAASKQSLYATNTLKVYTEDKYKQSDAIPDSEIERFAKVWRSELELMAIHGCLPHIILVLGQSIWRTHWQSLHPKHANASHYSVADYRAAGTIKDPVRHHLNRVVLDHAHGRHTLLLVRLHHPSARPPRRDAEWLAAQPEFREFVS